MVMINTAPNLKKFGRNADNIKTLQKAITSPFFGGSALQPLGSKNTKGKRTKTNPLREEIESKNIDVVYGGGYY